MKKLLLLLVLCLSVTSVYAKKTTQTLIGKVVSFECGDNCYLTIVDKAGKEYHALCLDTQPCEKMLEGMDGDLNGFKGKYVKVTVGTGKQYDGAGNIMGEMNAFEKIELLK